MAIARRLPTKSPAELQRLHDREKEIRVALGRCSDSARENVSLRLVKDTLQTHSETLLDFLLEIYWGASGFDRETQIPQVAEECTEILLECWKRIYDTDGSEHRKFVWESLDQMTQRLGLPALPYRKAAAPAATKSDSDRKRLWTQYHASCPQSFIIDVCWAAQQRRREWARWIHGQLKDGSKPDLAFRQVLRSGKEAKTLRTDMRPKGWK